MKQVCPCCKKEFNPPPSPSDGLSDMDALLSCDYCGSVLKWEAGVLKVVHESKEDFLPESAPDNSPEDKQSLLHQVEENLEKSQSAGDLFSGAEEGEVSPPAEGEVSPPVESEVSPPAEEEISPVEEGEPGLEKENFAEGAGEFLPPKEEIDNPPGDFLSTTSNVEGGEASLEDASSFADDDGVQASDEEEEFPVEEDQWDSPSSQEVNQDFSDVEKYGNTQASSEKGFLRYDLRIVGLDSLEIEQEVLSVLEDPRFKWDAREILGSQKEGVLEIKNLNPVKAMCLVSGLSFVSVELSWKQYMALNASSEVEEENPTEEEPPE